MKKRHLFFDLDHTLWDFDKNSEQTLLEAFKEFGIGELSGWDFHRFHEHYKQVNERLWLLYRNHTINKQEVRNRRFEEILEMMGIHDKPLSEAVSDYYVHHSPRKTSLIEGAAETLDYLSKSYDLHIITNGFNEVQHIKIEHSGLQPYIKEIITSEDAGANKPHPEIFDYALRKSGAVAEQSMIIGDSLEADILGGIKSGLAQVWFNPEQKQALEFQPTHEIRQLKELKLLL